jgi:hypothetical protein
MFLSFLSQTKTIANDHWPTKTIVYASYFKPNNDHAWSCIHNGHYLRHKVGHISIVLVNQLCYCKFWELMDVGRTLQCHVRR